MTLEGLGERICILGPSNSGKSTLAAAIGRARDLPVVHLDLLRHQPALHWVERPEADFTALHDAAVASDRWVLEGNYSRWLPHRLERATGFILLDASTPASLRRYLTRTAFERARIGGIPGVRDHLSPSMIRFILGPARAGRRRYRALFDELELPRILLANRRELERFYRDNDLERRV